MGKSQHPSGLIVQSKLVMIDSFYHDVSFILHFALVHLSRQVSKVFLGIMQPMDGLFTAVARMQCETWVNNTLFFI